MRTNISNTPYYSHLHYKKSSVSLKSLSLCPSVLKKKGSHMKQSLLISLLLITALSLSASPWNALGDTLTVIQMPILNVPAIHIPGETLQITCLAPQSTTGWQAALIHGSKNIPLQIGSSQYLSSPDRWELSATLPNIPVFELYDLRVTASGGLDDTTWNAVKLVPSRKSSYYFVHVTDSHMPTRVYYPDPGFDTDSLAVNDFRAVMDDINLINPEFVLFTGDLINEGELENFAGQHWYGWIQRILNQFDVPVYVTGGNHDIGGWNSTPAPQGSSRRSWWRYFGWPWLDSTNAAWGRFTQDYSFVYGDVHYIGLEAYDNYDNWRAQIYGGQSFILSQMQWLNAQMQLYPDKTRVLFYHYDFSDQLNLSTLGADMGLWGHIHSNNGSTSTYPYNLATRSTCDGNRAYRVVRVNGTQLQPLSTIYAGYSGSNISATFQPSNLAVADSVRAIFVNTQSQSFEHSLLRFNMPPGPYDYVVYNGSLTQVDRSPQRNVVYVNVNLSANATQYVSVASRPSSSTDDPTAPTPPLIHNIYPNPFRSALTIELSGAGKSPSSLYIYDLKGRRVDCIEVPDRAEVINWDSGDLPSGIYFLGGKKIVKL